MTTVKVNDNGARVQYTATASETNFTYPFLIFEESDLDVWRTRNTTVTKLVLNVDYTITGVGAENGGDVVLTTGATAGDIITIERQVPYTQLVDYSVGGDFASETVNFVNDKQTLLTQQVQMLIEDRGLTYTTTDQLTVKDNLLPQLPANTGTGIPIWTKNSGGDLTAALLVEDPDSSTLRSELASQVNGSDGAGIVGYFNIDTATGETVRDTLDALVTAPATVGFTTGDVKLTMKNSPDPGWIVWLDGSIGNAASGATIRANADTQALFILFWNNVADTWAPVSSGRGATGLDDFNANKTLTLPRVAGRLLGRAGTGAGLTPRALGEFLGEEDHTLTKAEIPTHVHQYDHLTTDLHQSGSATLCWTGHAIVNTGDGSPDGLAGDPHNNMPPTLFMDVHLKL